MLNIKSLSDEQLYKISTLAEIELANRSYIDYCKMVHHHRYKEARHNLLIANTLEKVERGELKRLIITMPPRHGKSMTVSETFPSYFIGKNPHRRVIEVSYSDSLARKFGRKNKQKIFEFGKSLFNLTLARGNTSNTNWGIEDHDGGMIASGIGGSITGEGADLLIIDDPIKNRKEADSITYRNSVWDEWENTLLTRLHPNGSIIIIMTRWHEDDLVGRLLEKEKEKWFLLNLPAIAEKNNDLLNRNVGQSLWPEHGFNEEWAKDKKIEVGSRTWSALYQQRPAPSEGSIFKREWWNYYKQAPSKFDEIIQSWDCTFKDGDDTDYVVGQVWGRIGADKYLLDQVRGQMSITSTMSAIENLSYKWPRARAKLIEDKANGPAVISMLRRKVSGLIPINPQGGKVVRAQAISPDVEAGNVYIPHSSIAPWINDYVEEFASFPNGMNDDQVDSTSQALNRLSRTETLNRKNYSGKGTRR